MSGSIHLDHCVIHVSNWQKSNAFYEQVMGAEVVPARSHYAYRFGQQQLNLHGPGVDPTPVARLPVAPGGSDLCFEWPGTVAEAETHLARHGIAVELGPVERFGAKGQGVSLYFRDPDGSLLEFITYSSP